MEIKLHSTSTDKQRELCKQFGLDVELDPPSVAYAKLVEAIEILFWGKDGVEQATPKQIVLAQKFGFDVSKFSKDVASSIIEAIMAKLNEISLVENMLMPGVAVINIHNDSDVLIISSIKDDGTVYFKGGNGKRAWARNLRRVQK